MPHTLHDGVVYPWWVNQPWNNQEFIYICYVQVRIHPIEGCHSMVVCGDLVILGVLECSPPLGHHHLCPP